MKFIVYGVPVPQGSARAFVVGEKIPTIPGAVKNARAIVQPDNKATLNHWRTQIANEARVALGTASRGLIAQETPIDFEGSISVRALFAFNRPKSVKKSERPHCIVKPDLDKLVRAVLDALTGVLWRDDSQVVTIDAVKIYLDAGSSEYLELHVANPQSPELIDRGRWESTK